jgi:hypothetical protein
MPPLDFTVTKPGKTHKKGWKLPPSPIALKVREGLNNLPPGTYSVTELQRLLCKTGNAYWNTGWGTVRAQLQVLPDWHWNGKKAPSHNKWVKEQKPMPVPHVPISTKAPAEKGPVTLCMERVEAMLESLCSSLGVKIPPKN